MPPCLRSAISPWFDCRQKLDIVRDKQEEGGFALSRLPEFASVEQGATVMDDDDVPHEAAGRGIVGSDLRGAPALSNFRCSIATYQRGVLSCCCREKPPRHDTPLQRAAYVPQRRAFLLDATGTGAHTPLRTGQDDTTL